MFTPVEVRLDLEDMVRLHAVVVDGVGNDPRLEVGKPRHDLAAEKTCLRKIDACLIVAVRVFHALAGSGDPHSLRFPCCSLFLGRDLAPAVRHGFSQIARADPDRYGSRLLCSRVRDRVELGELFNAPRDLVRVRERWP